MFGRRGLDRVALTAFSGSLASLDLIEAMGSGSAGVSSLRTVVATALAHLGPASSARQVFDVLAAPLMEACGADVTIVESSASGVMALAPADAPAIVLLASAAWNGDLRRLRGV